MAEDTQTIRSTPEEMMADLINKFMWVFFASSTIGLVVLIETLILNRGCSL